MAVYKKGAEPWKLFEGYAQAGKSGDLIIEDPQGYEDPIFLIDWTTGKYRDSLGTYGITHTFNEELNTGSYLLTAAAKIESNGQESDLLFPTPPTSGPPIPLGVIWTTTLNYRYMSFWFRLDSDFYNNNNEGHTLLVFSSGDHQKFSIFFDGDAIGDGSGQIGLGWKDELGSIEMQTTLVNGVSTGSWHHVVVKSTLSSTTVNSSLLAGVQIYVDGAEASTTVSFDGQDEVVHTDSTGPIWSIGGTGPIGNHGEGFGFAGALGNFSILDSNRDDIANTLYRLERWGASKLHSGIHSFGERIQKEQLDRNVKYPPHFGGLTATNTGLGIDGFNDSVDTSWNSERPVGSYIYSEEAVPFLGLDSNDALSQNWRSETKSLFFTEDMTDFAVPGAVSSQELYETIDTSSTNALVFDDTLRVGEFGDLQYKDRIVIDIPLTQTQDCTIGAGDQFGGQVGSSNDNFPPETQRHVAYYNFKQGNFEPKRDEWGIPYNIPPFSPAQGVTIDPATGWETSIKGLARPNAGYGFPWVNAWEQDADETLDLSNYLKDEFILEGYEIILDVEHKETSAGQFWNGFGLANKVGGVNRSNDFGTPLITDGDVYDHEDKAFATKIFTTFLLRQKPYYPDNSVLDIKDTLASSRGFSSVSHDQVDELSFLNKDTQVFESDYSIESLLSGEFIQSILPFSSSRDLITYGQTVLYTGDPVIAEPQGQSIANFNWDPEWLRSGDNQTNDILANEISLAGSSLKFADLMSDREQLLVEKWPSISSNTYRPVKINQIVPIKSISSGFSPTQWNRWVIGTKDLNMSDFRNGVEPLISPYHFITSLLMFEGSWPGGSDPLSLIENRANPSVVGTNEPNKSVTSPLINLDVYGIDPNTYSSELSTMNELSQEYRKPSVYSNEPIEESSGYILTPNDKLILGFMNSNSQHGDSFVYPIDQDGNRVGDNINLHQNSLLIPQQTGAKLRLFGRYKRNDKPVNPTPNLSLFHGKNVNEPIGSEDIRDQYQVEDITSYAGGISDDIMGDDSNSFEISLSLGFEGFNDSINYPSINDNFIPDLSGSFAALKYEPTQFLNSDTFPPVQNETSGLEFSWATFNSSIFPGLPLIDDGTGNYVSFNSGQGTVGEKIGAFLGTPPEIGLGQGPTLEDCFPAVLQFLTNDPKYIWNTGTYPGYPIGTSTAHLRKGGVLLEELKEEGIQNPTGGLLSKIEQDITLPIYDTNSGTIVDTVFPRDVQNFETFTFSTNTAVSAWNYSFLLSVYTDSGWKPAKVRFVPVVIDVADPPTIENGNYFLSLGSTFYFEPDDSGIWNNGDSKLISSNALGSRWSYHLPNSISDELRIFIVVAHGQPTATSWTPYSSGTVEAWNGDSFNPLSSGADTGNFPGLGQYHLQVGQGQSLTTQQVYEKISDIISYECEQNSSLLLIRDEEQTPSQTFKFPLTEAAEEFYDEAAQILEGFAESLSSVEDIYDSGNLYTKEDFDDSGWNKVLILNLDDQNLEYRLNKLATIDWTTWPVPNFSFEKEDVSLNSYKGQERFFGLSRRVVARTTEPITKLDIYGELSGERTAGLLGSLKKQFVLQGTAPYHDSIAKRPDGVSNTDFTTWTNVNEPIEIDLENSLKTLHNFRTELEVPIVSKYDTDSDTRSFVSEGIYQRINISNISGDIVWPPLEYTLINDLELPLKSWISTEFPYMYQKNSDISMLLRGMGSGPNGKINVKPQASPLPGWTDEGPQEVADSMIMEPLRGVRWGAMHPTPLRKNYHFSIRNFGQHVDFIDSGVDGTVSPQEVKHASYPFTGPAVVTKIFSRQNPDVEITDTSLTDEEKELFRYNRWSIVAEPFDDTSPTVDENGNTPITSRKTPASIVEGLGSGNNLKVNLVNQMGKSATFTPGNIINRIKRT